MCVFICRIETQESQHKKKMN